MISIIIIIIIIINIVIIIIIIIITIIIIFIIITIIFIINVINTIIIFTNLSLLSVPLLFSSLQPTLGQRMCREWWVWSIVWAKRWTRPWDSSPGHAHGQAAWTWRPPTGQSCWSRPSYGHSPRPRCRGSRLPTQTRCGQPARTDLWDRLREWMPEREGKVRLRCLKETKNQQCSFYKKA